MEVCDPPKYDLTTIEYFIKEFELQIPDQQILLALDVMLKVTSARWWPVHKDKIEDWQQCKRLLQVIFRAGKEYIVWKYTGLSSPIEHVT
jgi:hypothetical protein